MKRLVLGAILLALAWPERASALPVAPGAFCDVYPDSPSCLGGFPACTLCHAGTPPTRNPYGMAIEALILPGATRPLDFGDFLAAFPTAVRAVEGGDADGDTFTNLDEILAGSAPGNVVSFPKLNACGGIGVNDDWSICSYDTKFTFKKVFLDFCGRSPTPDEYRSFVDAGAQQSAIHTALDACLDSEFWLGKDGQVWQLAHRKIRPIKAIKQGDEAGPIPLADYFDDYNLFVYTQIDNHDVREVLTADFFVTRRTNPTRYAIAGANDPTGQQTVAQTRRAGMMTTRWNLVLNVMFTALPRTAAAQAYRSFLGRDIARLEGLVPVANEPVDYDDKGVTADECARCHSTLDPLSYPFKNYQGLTGNVGTYDPQRIQDDFRNDGANILAMPETGYFMGQPVSDLMQWAERAVASDAFAEATTRDYWRLLLGRDPVNVDEQDEFHSLWSDLRGRHNYGVEHMLHDLIDTEAYGAP